MSRPERSALLFFGVMTALGSSEAGLLVYSGTVVTANWWDFVLAPWEAVVGLVVQLAGFWFFRKALGKEPSSCG